MIANVKLITLQNMVEIGFFDKIHDCCCISILKQFLK